MKFHFMLLETSSTVELLNNGQIGSEPFVLYRGCPLLEDVTDLTHLYKIFIYIINFTKIG